ncbi:MAG: iron-containing alcohol dehydrogenase, partial [Desulfomonilia bacterium]|nr:iron-containing alcohol dehydrogenase [Desulfomonilia bacterium]
MSYWFQDPAIKGLLPLATSTSIKGLVTFFNMPALVIGSNSLAEAFMPQPSIIDIFTSRCTTKRSFFVTDVFSEKFAQKLSSVLATAGFTTVVWNKALPEAPIDNVRACAEAMKSFEPDMIFAVGGGSVMDTAKAAWVLYERPDITDLGQVHPLGLLGLRKKAGFTAVPTTASQANAPRGLNMSLMRGKIRLRSASGSKRGMRKNMIFANVDLVVRCLYSLYRSK